MRAPLVVAVLWLAAGMVAGLLRPVPFGGGPLLLATGLLGALAATVVGRPAPATGRSRLAIPLLFVASGLLLGAITRAGTERSCRGRVPPGLELAVRATVAGSAGSRGRLRMHRISVDGAVIPCEGELPARFDGPSPPVGSTVDLRGRWWTPPGGGSGPVRVGVLLVDDGWRATDGGRGAIPSIAGARRLARERVDSVFPRRAPLAAALLLAQRDGLDRSVRDRFARAGLSHLLAISGLHVAIIAGILLLLVGLSRLGRRAGAALASAGTVGYVALLGAPHSAARAALQITLLLSARTVQRPTRTESLVATAALVLLAADPTAVLSPGFQLSFAGVAGILAFRPPLLRALHRVHGVWAGTLPVGRWVVDGLATSAAATAATAPIVAWHFGRVAPIGIVANLVAIPLLSVTVPALALALAVGWFWLPAGRFLGGAGALLLDALDRTAALAAAVPGGTVAVPGSVAATWTAAVVVGYGVSRRLGPARTAIRIAAWTGMAAAVLLVAPVRPTLDRVELHAIDVGQGDAIAIRSPAGRWLLVDAGMATDGYDAGAARVVPYLAHRGVRRLEGLILTHPDADHIGGAAAVISALRPRWVADPGIAAGKPLYQAVLRSARDGRVEWVAARRGTRLELDGMTLDVLYPAGPPAPTADANDASVVLRIEYGAFAALLTGDAPVDVEARLVQRYGNHLDADVLKVGHHGSLTSTSPALLAATGATHALISVGRGNRYGHPHPVVVARLAGAGLDIARTDRHGSVIVRGSSDGRVDITTERGGRP